MILVGGKESSVRGWIGGKLDRIRGGREGGGRIVDKGGEAVDTRPRRIKLHVSLK